MKVTIMGTLLRENSQGDAEYVPVDLECAALFAEGATSLEEILICKGFVVLTAEDAGKKRFFLFIGSRVIETKTPAQAKRLGELLPDNPGMGLENPPSVDYYHDYRMIVEVAGAFTHYSEVNG